MFSFKDFWKRQTKNFKVIVVRDVINYLFSSSSPAIAVSAGGAGTGGSGEGEIGSGGQYWSIFLKRLGADSTQIGLIQSISSAVNMLLAIPFGWLIDRTPKKKRIYFLGKILSLPGALLRYIATSWPIGVFIGGLEAIATRLMGPPSQIILIDSLNDKDRIKGLTINQTLVSIAGLIGPIICAIIISYFGGLESADSIRPIFLIQFAVGLTTLIVVLTQMQEVAFPVVKRKTGIKSNFTELLQEIPLLKLLVLRHFVRMICVGIGSPFLIIYMVDIKGADEFILAARSAAVTAFSVLMSIPIGILADRFGRFKVCYIGRFISGVGIVLLIFTPLIHPELLIISGVLESSVILTIIGFTAFEQELVPLKNRGQYLGITTTFNAMASVIAPILGGLIWNVNPDYIWWIKLLGDILVVLPIMIFIERKARKV